MQSWQNSFYFLTIIYFIYDYLFFNDLIYFLFYIFLDGSF